MTKTFSLILLLIHFTAAAANRRPRSLYSRSSRGRCSIRSFWSSKSEAWLRMLPSTSTVWKVFGSRAAERYRSEMTLLESTGGSEDRDDEFRRLVREASAALLNSYARKRFPLSAWKVKTLVIQALV